MAHHSHTSNYFIHYDIVRIINIYNYPLARIKRITAFWFSPTDIFVGSLQSGIDKVKFEDAFLPPNL